MIKKIATALALLCAPLAASAEASVLRDQTGAYEVQVLVDGAPAPTYYQNGESYVLGSRGARYTLRIYNRSGQRIEAVVSVDGRDAIDGRAADYAHKRGYLVPAYGQVDVDGWRLTSSQAAAFRFSSVAGSYAARTGSARDVGVIGVAVFPERAEPQYPVYVPRPHPRPYWNRGEDDYSSRDEAAPPPPSAKADKAPAPNESRSAPSASPPQGAYGSGGAMAERDSPRQRPGLGTAFGERVDSAIQEVPFYRQNTFQPTMLLGVRYNDRSGLLAMGINVDGDGDYYDGENYRRRTAQPFRTNQTSYATPPPGWEYRY